MFALDDLALVMSAKSLRLEVLLGITLIFRYYYQPKKTLCSV